MGTTNKNSCKTAAVMSLLGKGAAPAQDIQILPDQPRDIETITGEILAAKRTGGEAILTIGKRLIEAKEVLPHGGWLPWLEERVEFSEKAAQNFMRIARNYSNPQALADLGATKALMLLALPEETRDEFISTPHSVNGEEKTVIDMTSRELEAAIKERDAARRAAEQAQADRSAAEQARQKMEQDMAVANERIAGLNAEVEEQASRAREAREESDRLTAELEELRSRPVEVAVEVDAAAVEAARKETEAAMQDKLNRARAARDKALEKRYELETALTNAKADLEQAKAESEAALEKARAEAQAIREQAEKAEKKAALASNEDLVLFRELFDRTQEQINRMGGVLLKLRGKDPETAEKLKMAMLAMFDKGREVAQA